MKIINAYRFNLAEPNTFIGGIGDTVTTPALLASKLGISQSIINNFVVDGSNNVSCYMSATYTIANALVSGDVFWGSTSITHYFDNNGMCTAIGESNFRNSSIVEVYFPNLTTMGGAAFEDTRSLYKADFGNGTYNGIINSFLNSSVFILKGLENATSSVVSVFENCENLEYLQFNNLHLYSFFSRNTAKAQIIELGKNKLGYGCQRNNNIKKLFLFGTSWAALGNCTNAFIYKLILPNISSNIGGEVTDTGSFTGIVPNGKAWVHANLQTNNSGARDGDIAYLEDVKGWTIVYIANSTAPSAVVDLSASNITASTVILNFTEPSSLNAIDHYDVYIDFGDGRGFVMIHGKDEILMSGGTISNLPPATEISIKIRTIDIYYNRSGFSNEITITTT